MKLKIADSNTPLLPEGMIVQLSVNNRLRDITVHTGLEGKQAQIFLERVIVEFQPGSRNHTCMLVCGFLEISPDNYQQIRFHVE